MEDGLGKLSMLAVLSAAAAAIGVFLILAANNIADNAERDYFEGRISIDEYRDSTDTAGDIWVWGEAAIGAGVVLVAVAVINKEPGELRTLRTRLEKDFYRKCPSCGSWNTKFVHNCSTCGMILPELSEFRKTEMGPTRFKEGT